MMALNVCIHRLARPPAAPVMSVHTVALQSAPPDGAVVRDCCEAVRFPAHTPARCSLSRYGLWISMKSAESPSSRLNRYFRRGWADMGPCAAFIHHCWRLSHTLTLANLRCLLTSAKKAWNTVFSLSLCPPLHSYIIIPYVCTDLSWVTWILNRHFKKRTGWRVIMDYRNSSLTNIFWLRHHIHSSLPPLLFFSFCYPF